MDFYILIRRRDDPFLLESTQKTHHQEESLGNLSYIYKISVVKLPLFSGPVSLAVKWLVLDRFFSKGLFEP